MKRFIMKSESGSGRTAFVYSSAGSVSGAIILQKNPTEDMTAGSILFNSI